MLTIEILKDLKMICKQPVEFVVLVSNEIWWHCWVFAKKKSELILCLIIDNLMHITLR